MSLEDEFKILIGGYLGIREMDEYKLKEYVLQDIETYIKNFFRLHSVSSYQEIIEDIQKNVSLKRKLQDSLLVLRKINGPFDLTLLVKGRIEELKEK